MTTRRRLALLVAAAAIAAGCLTPTQRREDTLVREARLFNDDFRWGRFEQLTNSLPRQDAQKFLALVGAVGDDLTLADFEVASITFASGSEAATVLVKFEWYLRREQIVRGTMLEQRWEHQDGRWVVARQRRVRGDKFPLVPEPPPAAGADAGAAKAAGAAPTHPAAAAPEKPPGTPASATSTTSTTPPTAPP
jgi:hypothetical protein